MTKTEDRNQAFLDVFRQVVMAFQPRNIERGTSAVYAAALASFHMDVIRESAAVLIREQTFWPSTGEWVQAARSIVIARRDGQRQREDCPRCEGLGLVRVNYASGEPFDVAICACRAGRWYRRAGEGYVRVRLRLTDEQDVLTLEEADAIPDAPPPEKTSQGAVS